MQTVFAPRELGVTSTCLPKLSDESRFYISVEQYADEARESGKTIF